MMSTVSRPAQRSLAGDGPGRAEAGLGIGAPLRIATKERESMMSAVSRPAQRSLADDGFAPP